jgi:hypothetical protein
MSLRDKIQAGRNKADNFQVRKNLLCYFPNTARRHRWVVPATLRPMLLNYFHDCVLSGHLGARKIFYKVATNSWWHKTQAEVFKYVHRCDLCQRTKSALDAHVGWHASNPSAQPMEKLFLNFVGPLTHTRQGNTAILVILDAFSKFVFFWPVRKISSRAVSNCLEKVYLPAFGTPHCIVTDNARAFCCKQIKDLCFRWGMKYIITTPYYPQALLAERVNRNLK